MSEYRYNLITNQWVILAPRRGGRPSDFSRCSKRSLPDYDEDCPFCPGHEQMTPPETFAVRPTDTKADNPGWSVRVVPNKYPALSDQTDIPSVGGGVNSRPGRGLHEVIIESPIHNRSFDQHEFEHVLLVCRTLRERYRIHQENPLVRLVSVFYNQGRTSGASLAHPHFQLIGQSVIPPRLTAQLKHCRDYYEQYDKTVFDEVIDSELAAGNRIIAAPHDFVALCPFASEVPFEVYLLPRVSQNHFGMITDDMLGDFVQLLQRITNRLSKGLGDPDYNLVFHTAPADGDDYPGFRWYVQLYPRLNVPGGFELTTGVYINTVSAESATQFYRGESEF
ncbi:galactose-1-phosphate uridylyltransferase [Planctomycetota bacterium]